jgi:uncharacterized protein (DUF302 family)
MSDELSFEVKIAKPYEAAMEMVEVALKEEGFGILTRIDVKATLKQKLDQEFRPYSILGACNPNLAHMALSHNGKIGILLPCNVTVEESPEGGSTVNIGNPDMMLGMGGFDRDEVLAGVAREARERLTRVAKALEGES